VVGTPDGKFGRGTEWAVREFQIYAGMSHVAQLNRQRLYQLTNNPQAGETAQTVAALGMVPNTPQTTPEDRKSYYVATLDQVENTARYTGPISGVVNERTRNTIRHWLNNNYRCPVVIEAWNMQNNQRTTLFQGGVNIWKHNDITDDTPRMFSVDFSRKYTFPVGRIANVYQVLGYYVASGQFGGGHSIPRYAHCWSEAEMMPGLLIGPGNTVTTLQANPASATTKTYKVVRAVAEQECIGYFDSLNSYDNALMSFGPCHWTLGIHENNAYGNGELSAFLSYLHTNNRAAYMTAFGDYGLLPAAAWGANGSNQHMADQGKYAGWIRWHSDTADPATAANLVPAAINNTVADIPLVPRARDESHYFKSWHWFYRWAMAGRTIAGVQRAMWNMARMRIRSQQNFQVQIQTTNAQGVNVNINTTLGQIFTSEKGMAIIHRWHVYRPGHVGGVEPSMPHVKNAIRTTINNSNLNWNIQPVQWTNLYETELVNRLLTAANGINNTHAAVAAWPGNTQTRPAFWRLRDELGTLSSARNSFTLDAEGI